MQVLGCLGTVALIVASMLWRAFAIWKAWEWHLASSFGHLTFVQVVIGVSILGVVVMDYSRAHLMTAPEGREWWNSIVEAATEPLVVLALAWFFAEVN